MNIPICSPIQVAHSEHHGNQNQRTIHSPTETQQHIHVQAMLQGEACGETDRLHSEPLQSMQLLDNKKHSHVYQPTGEVHAFINF